MKKCNFEFPHVCNITDNVNTGWIKIPYILLNVAFPCKKRLVKI